MGGGEETGLGTAPGQTPRPSGSSPQGGCARALSPGTSRAGLWVADAPAHGGPQ